MSIFKDINFSSVDSDYLGAAAAATLTSSDDDDLAFLSPSSVDDAATTASSSEATFSDRSDEHELGEFLWEALSAFDSSVNDFPDLCPA